MVKHTLFVLICLIALEAGCNSKIGSLDISLVWSWDKEQDPFREASFLRFRVDGPGVLVGPLEFPFRDHTGLIDKIPAGKDRKITVEGLGPEKNAVSRGRTGPLEINADTSKIELYIGRLNTFSYAPGQNHQSLKIPRVFHSATLLSDGSVLVCGGTSSPWHPEQDQALPPAIKSAELIDGNAMTFKLAGEMSYGRLGHTASLLPSGNILIAGGSSLQTSTQDAGLPKDANGIDDSNKIDQGLDDLGSADAGPADLSRSASDGFNPASKDAGIFAGNLLTGVVSPIEVYQEDDGRFIKGENLISPRVWHQAAQINDGVFIIGGSGFGEKAMSQVEYYRKGTLETKPGLLTGRRAFSLTVLKDGTLLVAGGIDENGQVLDSIEMLAPGSPSWRKDPSLKLKMARAYHTATLLQDGTVLFVGGLTNDIEKNATSTSERLDPKARTTRMEKQLKIARWAHTATQLEDGRVLVVGGFTGNHNGPPSNTVDEILFLDGEMVQVKQLPPMSEARAGHTATLLKSGMLLIIGGLTQSGPSQTAEVFIY